MNETLIIPVPVERQPDQPFNALHRRGNEQPVNCVIFQDVFTQFYLAIYGDNEIFFSREKECALALSLDDLSDFMNCLPETFISRLEYYYSYDIAPSVISFKVCKQV